MRVLLETLLALVATLNKITDSGDFDRESAGNAVFEKRHQFRILSLPGYITFLWNCGKVLCVHCLVTTFEAD